MKSIIFFIFYFPSFVYSIISLVLLCFRDTEKALIYLNNPDLIKDKILLGIKKGTHACGLFWIFVILLAIFN